MDLPRAVLIVGLTAVAVSAFLLRTGVTIGTHHDKLVSVQHNRISGEITYCDVSGCFPEQD